MANYLVDPIMLCLEDPLLVSPNLKFYSIVIELIRQKRITLLAYDEMLKILAGKITANDEWKPTPFPIDLKNISDPVIRKEAESVNRTFSSFFLHHHKKLEIDACGGDQDYTVNERFPEKSIEIDLMFHMLTNCYCDEQNRVSNSILSGKNVDGSLLRSESIIQRCGCSLVDEFEQVIHFIWPDDLIDPSIISTEKLARIITPELYNASPSVITDGTHHTYIQDTAITDYKTISKSNKSVLKMLRHLGLSKIHLHAAFPYSSGKEGEIKITSSEEDIENDNIQGILYGENNNCAEVELSFPSGIGKLIIGSIGRQWTEDKTNDLVKRVKNG